MVDKNRYYEDLFDNNFPAPEPRDKQKPAVKGMLKDIHDGRDIIQLNAPPGLGKSIMLGTIANAVDGDIFYTTPLNTLVDQLENDPYIGDRLMTMKGQSHYECINDYAPPGVMIDKAPCQKQSNFDCDIKDECLYYGRREQAKDHPFVVTNLSYLMSDSMMKEDGNDSAFEDRDILIVDECQNIDEFALDFISFTISRNTVPEDVWKNIRIPHERYEDDIDKLIDWVDDELADEVKRAITTRRKKDRKTDKDVQELDELNRYKQKIDKFLTDCIDHDWIPEIDFYSAGSSNNKIKFKPVTVDRFLHNLLWDRGEQVILSSATIPMGNWIKEIGHADSDTHKFTLGSLFDVANRPIITSQTIGKMTYNEREDNALPMAKKIKQIAEFHDGQKGMVHCRSYGIAELLRDAFYENGMRSWFNNNVHLQKREFRDRAIDEWQGSSKPLMFSVNMSEGISLDDDQCRYQILAKVLFPNMSDKRTKFRLQERGEQIWYDNQAAIQIEQAYGRAVRGMNDWAAFYILDESAIGLINKRAGRKNDWHNLFHDWFLEALVEMKYGKTGVDPNMSVISNRSWL